MPSSLFFEIASVIVVASAMAFLVSWLRQPLMIAYILAGIIVGPSVLSLAHTANLFETMSQLGVAFLLFTVGLGINWRGMKEIGHVAIATGLGQILFTWAAGYGIARLLAFDSVTSMYLGLALALSSTIVVVKLLADKRDLDTLYGRISIGFLLVQDFVAMFALLMLGALGQGASLESVVTVSLLKGAGVIAILAVMWLYVGPALIRFASRSQELLLLFSVAWCFLIASLLNFFGFGLELGALLAGLSLAGTPYHQEVNARMRPLRDFFLVIFFILLGAQLQPTEVITYALPAAALSAFVLIGDPIILLLIMRALGYHPRTSFLTGTTVAQVSEFSFIILALAVTVGHLAPGILTLVTMVALITIAVSSYLIKYNNEIYRVLKPVLHIFERGSRRHEEIAIRERQPEVILLGCDRVGQELLAGIKQLKKPYVIVDFQPSVVLRLQEDRLPVVYGDGSDADFLEDVRAQKAKLIISTIPSLPINLGLLSFLRAKRSRAVTVIMAKTVAEASACYDAGATAVFIPSVLGAHAFRDILRTKQLAAAGWKLFGKRQERLLRLGY